MDAIAPGDLGKNVPQLLADFAATVVSQKSQSTMETLPVDHAQQLDVVLRLAGMLLHRSNLRPRFLECIQAFTQGIGNGPGRPWNLSLPATPRRMTGTLRHSLRSTRTSWKII